MSEKTLITSQVAVFTWGGKTYTAMKTHDYFNDIVAALKNKDFKLAHQLYHTKNANKKVEIKGNDFYFDGQKFDPLFAEAYQVAKEHGLSTDKLNRFFVNLAKNPSPISVHAFTGFTAKSKMPITDRGTFLAYKKISRGSYVDIYSRTFDNRPECVVSMNREKVDSVQENTCSTGFHVCSHTYLNQFGGPDDVEIVVEIHPKDVVAVPPDYQMTKMRVASYRVLCTLPYFREKIKSYYADALGMIPIFNTDFTKDWNVMEDVELTDEMSERRTKMSVQEWLQSREEAK